MTHEEPPAGGKGGRLVGGALSVEALESSRTVLRRHRGLPGQTVGLQQWFSPREAAELVAAVIGPAGTALDPTAGDGALLAPWPRDLRHGVEIDRDQVAASSYHAVTGDLQRVAPLMRAARLEFDVLLLNPPFGLTWSDGAGAPVGSVRLTLRYALAVMRPLGQGALICGRDRFHAEIAATPEAGGVYAVVEVPDLFDRVDLGCVVCFFTHPSCRTTSAVTLYVERRRADLADRRLASEIRRARTLGCRWLADERTRAARGVGEAMRAIQAEHDARQGARRRTHRFDVALAGRVTAVHPSAYAMVALAARNQLEPVRRLHGKPPSYFALNGREWRTLERAGEDGAIRLDPLLAEAVGRARRDCERALVPLYPLPAQQRLGWLDRDGDGQEQIRCTHSDPERGYLAGERYPVRADSKINRTEGERVETDRRGEPVLRRYAQERKLLRLRIGAHEFDESAESIAYLARHFEIPDPGDVASRFPTEFADARGLLEQIARDNRFTFKSFQLDDIARLVVKGSGLVAHEVGLGKTLIAMSLAEAHARRGAPPAALFVTPQDLIDQWRAEAGKFFGRELELIRGPSDARAVARRLAAGGGGWFITHFEALSLVGRRAERLPEHLVVHPREYYRLSAADRARAVKHPAVQLRDGAATASAAETAERALTSAEVCPGCLAKLGADDGYDGVVCRRCGEVRLARRTKAAAHPLSLAFADATIYVDEISLMAGESLRSEAVRALRARHRYGGSGTPIKNFVNDLYHPLQWILRGGSEQFPYPLKDGGRAKFEQDFCVIESLYGRSGTAQSGRVVRRRILPEATNLSMLWRTLCSGAVRRRKEDTGEPLVPRTLHVVRVPAGVAQLAQHGAWLRRFPEFFSQRRPDHPLVRAGVVERFAAALGMLWKLERAATLPEGDPDAAWTGVEGVSNWTPKTLRVLEIALAAARAGRKIVVFSDLVETGVFLAERLTERGVRAIHITEERAGALVTKGPRRRASEIERFTRGDAQVLCAGIQAIRQGWNFSMAQEAIVCGLPYSFEVLEQALGRVHRLTSTRPVDVHVVLAAGTLDERKWELIGDKGATSDLALDGRLVEEPTREVNWQRVLEEMRAAGVQPSGDEVPEAEVKALWRRGEGPFAPLASEPAPAAEPAARLIDSAPAPGSPPHASSIWDAEPELAVDEQGQLALPV